MGKWKVYLFRSDGFGRSDTRDKLREFFGIDANHITYNALLACDLPKEAKKFVNKQKFKLNSDSPYKR